MDNRKFKAILYVGTEKILGSVEVTNRHMIFTPSSSAGRRLDWDEYSISATVEDELMGIHSTLNPDHSIFVQDAAFAKVFAKEMGIKVQSSFFHWWSRRPFRAAMALTAIVFLSTTLFLAFLRTQGKFFARFVSVEQEAAIGAAAIEKSAGKDLVIFPPKMLKDWEVFLNKLLDQPELKAYKWKIFVTNDPVVNAYALPGGYLTLTAGFIDQAESADEILGVLAHETAHVTQRHGVQAIAGNMSANILLSVLFLGSSNIMSGLIYAADSLHSLQYSRLQELEADRLGVQYLVQAGIPTDGMYAFFSRKQPDAVDMSGPLSYLSTHPMDEDRLRQIRKLDPNHSGKQIIYNLAPVKKFLSEYNNDSQD